MDNAFIKSIRWTLAGGLIILLFFLLSAFAVVTSLSLQVTDKQNVKNALRESGVYERAVSLSVDMALGKLEDAAEGEGEDVSRDDILGNIATEQEVKDALSDVFPPEWLRVQAEAAIDEVYAFLAEEKDEINIEIDLSEKNDEAQAALASIFKARLNALPDCEAGTRGTIDDINLFEAECLPQNISRNEAEALIDQKVTEVSLLEGQVVSIDPLEGGVEAVGPVRKVFFFARSAPVLLWSVALVLVALLFALVPGKKHKLYTQAALWGLAGVFLAGGVIFAKANFESIFADLSSSSGADVAPEVLEFVKGVLLVIYNDIINRVLVFVGVYILLAAGFVAFARWQKSSAYFRYISFAFAGIVILGLAGIIFIFLNAKEKGVFEPANTENTQIQEQFYREGGSDSEEHEAGDMEALPEPPKPGEQDPRYDYKNPPRGSDDNDPNAIRGIN